jgi:cobaltochelatase CobS
MVRLADDVRKLFMGSDGQGGQLAITFSTRTLVRWAKLSTKFKGAPNPLGYALDLALLNRARHEDATAITRLAKDILGSSGKTIPRPPSLEIAMSQIFPGPKISWSMKVFTTASEDKFIEVVRSALKNAALKMGCESPIEMNRMLACSYALAI